MKRKLTMIFALLLIPALVLAQHKTRGTGKAVLERDLVETTTTPQQPSVSQPAVTKGAAAPILIGKTANAYAPQSSYTNLIAYDPNANLAAMVKRADLASALGSGRIVYHISDDGGNTWSPQIGPVNIPGLVLGRHPNVVISNPTGAPDALATKIVITSNDLTFAGGGFGDVNFITDDLNNPGFPVFTARDTADAFSYAGAVDLRNGDVYYSIVGANSNPYVVRKVSSGGTVLGPRVTVIADLVGTSGGGTSIDVGNDGTVHYVARDTWTDAPSPTTFTYRYHRSADGGATWSAAEFVAPSVVAGRVASNYEFDMIVDSRNQVHIAAILVDTLAAGDNDDDTDLYDLVRSPSGTWSGTKIADLRQVVFEHPNWTPGAIQDLNNPEYAKTKDGGNLALKWMDTAVGTAIDSPPDMFVSSWNVNPGAAWDAPKNVTNSPNVWECFSNLATYMSVSGTTGQLYSYYIVPSDPSGATADLAEHDIFFVPEAQVDIEVIVGVAERPESAPREFALKQNYPNPFNPATKISFSLPKTSQVKLQVFDMLGHEVATLINGRREAGAHDIEFAPKDLPSGVYFYRLQTGEQTLMKKDRKSVV